MDFSPKYLVMVTEANNNKFYKMIPNGNSFTVEYGRIGNENFATATYQISDWNKKYNEKIKKGYVDQTRLVQENISQIKRKSEYKDIPDKFIADIVLRLQEMARNAISQNYTIKSTSVTMAMIKEAEIIISELIALNEDIDKFNKKLIELFHTIPRKMENVNFYLANSRTVNNVIQREQDLLDVMKGQVAQNIIIDEDIKDEDIKDFTILEAMGLEFSKCSDEDITLIKRELQNLSSNYINSWKVVNKKTQSNFDKYIKEKGIDEIKLLWHGSRNENFWSIITMGLSLKPNAKVTGKMFGFGIYFAPKAQKSYGYTDGGFWAGGHSNTKFMALFNVAYGKPYVVYDFNSKFYNFNESNLEHGCNCVHAKSDRGMLRNDEIIVYNQNAITIKYLVELR